MQVRSTAAAEKWYFSKEQLANTPSRKCGIDADKELSYRQQSARFIQDMGQRLHVTQLCINTAIVYMHRFYMFHPFTKFHRNAISTCALFLAAKVEEQPRKIEHVIKVAHMCLHRDGPTLDTKAEAYMEQSHELVINENIMLQTLGFDIGIDHTHTYVVKCCQLVLASEDLAQASYFMATNSLHLTTMCLQYKPTTVACLCIHMACKWSNWKIPQSSEGKEWFWYVDKAVTHQVLEELTSEFLAILDKCPSRLKRRIMSGKESQSADKKSKLDLASSSMGSSAMDQETDLETFLNSKEFLDAQRDSIVINPSPSSSRLSMSHNNNSSDSKPSPALTTPKMVSATTVASPPPLAQQQLSSPSRKRTEPMTLASYREKIDHEKKDQKKRDVPPKPKEVHNAHSKSEAESVDRRLLQSQQHHHPERDRHKSGRGYSESYRADEKITKIRSHHHHHHHRGEVPNANHLSEKSSKEDSERKSGVVVPSALRGDPPAFCHDSVSEDLKRLESLSSLMASVEIRMPEDKKMVLRVKDEPLSPVLPSLPEHINVTSPVTVKIEPNSATVKMEASSKPGKQSRHSRSKSPIAQLSSQGVEVRQTEKKSHKKKSPIKDHQLQHKEISSVKMGTLPPTPAPQSGKRERHKEKRTSINQEGLKVKIRLNKGEVKTTSESNHVLTPPLLPPPPLPLLLTNPAKHPDLKMKINRKLLENNGKANMQLPKDLPEASESLKPKDVPKQIPSGSTPGDAKKPEGLKLVISKDRISSGSYSKNKDRESRKRERGIPKGHDPLRNSDAYQNKVAIVDPQLGRGGSRNNGPPLPNPPPPPLIRGPPPPQGHHFPASNGKADPYMHTQQQYMMPYPQPPFYPPHQQYFHQQYQGMPPGYPQFLTNPPPPPPLIPPPHHGSHHPPPLPRDPPPPPPPLPPE